MMGYAFVWPSSQTDITLVLVALRDIGRMVVHILEHRDEFIDKRVPTVSFKVKLSDYVAAIGSKI